MRTFLFLSIITFFALSVSGQDNNFYYTNSGKIIFSSEAQQEIIKAESNDLRGIVDVLHKTFVFKITIRTFTGFNSGLQQEHFNEKFLESDKYPEASFIGKIIEDIDFTRDGIYEVRAKGKLWIHGIGSERIIKSTVIVNRGKTTLESHFSVMLSDHNIKVPKVVHEKIASEINVTILAAIKKK